jgi:hypothetical protein
MGILRILYKIIVGKTVWKRPVWRQVVDRRIILKWILVEQDVNSVPNSSG